jgi:hypothetical protein
VAGEGVAGKTPLEPPLHAVARTIEQTATMSREVII